MCILQQVGRSGRIVTQAVGKRLDVGGQPVELRDKGFKLLVHVKILWSAVSDSAANLSRVKNVLHRGEPSLDLFKDEDIALASNEARHLARLQVAEQVTSDGDRLVATSADLAEDDVHDLEAPAEGLRDRSATSRSRSQRRDFPLPPWPTRLHAGMCRAQTFATRALLLFGSSSLLRTSALLAIRTDRPVVASHHGQEVHRVAPALRAEGVRQQGDHGCRILARNMRFRVPAN